jgi:hypothetical protein
VLNVELGNAGAIFLQATMQTIVDNILLLLYIVSRCAVALQNLAAALQSHQEHIAAEMHTSKQQLKFNATTICSTMQLIILCCLLQLVLLARKLWQLAQNSAAVLL